MAEDLTQITPETLRVLARYRERPTPKDAAYLLKQYEGYLCRWIRYLKSPFGTEMGEAFIKFLRFFHLMGDPAAKHETIRKSLRVYDLDDIQSEVRAAFLEACHKDSYPQFAFVTLLARRVRVLIHDPMVFGAKCEIGYDNEICSDDEPPIFLSLPGQQVSINPDWVSGIAAHNELLASLSPRDRELLIRHYVAGQTAKEIAEDLHYSNEQIVWNAITRALKRVRKLRLPEPETELTSTL